MAAAARGSIFELLFPKPRPATAAAPHEMMMTSPGPVAAPEMKAVGELRLSDLEKIAHLGAGASGVVAKVRHRGTGAVFALKTAYYDYEGVEIGEMKVLRRVAQPGSSPYVVECHATFRTPAGQPTMLLELMDAGSLKRVLCRRGGRGLPEPALAELAARCVAGLVHIHSRGVAHLDLRPDNLLANSRGEVKIGDFSVSVIFLPREGEGRQDFVGAGSAAHMSPERFEPNAQAGLSDACADIWSLGITILELFLGRCPILPPGVRPSWDMLMEAICYGEPPSIPASTAASEELREFVESCLQKDQRQRPTASQLLTHPFVAGRDAEASRRQLREIIVETMQEEKSR